MFDRDRGSSPARAGKRGPRGDTRSTHMFIETEQTPNPATLKFLPGRSVMAQGTADFASAEAAERSPLAQRLFQVEGVSGVFLGSRSEEHTSELQSQFHLVCRLLLQKKNIKKTTNKTNKKTPDLTT